MSFRHLKTILDDTKKRHNHDAQLPWGIASKKERLEPNYDETNTTYKTTDTRTKKTKQTKKKKKKKKKHKKQQQGKNAWKRSFISY